MVLLKNIENEVAFLTLNRVEKRNSINSDLLHELTSAIDELENNSAIKFIVIKGKENIFCAGADLNYLLELKNNNTPQNIDDSNLLALLFKKIINSKKIYIAAVKGPALAGGCGLAASCDIIIADHESTFGCPEVKIGFIPAIISKILIRKIGFGAAKKLLLSGDNIDANEAFRIGLVDYLTQDIDKGLRELIQKLSSMSSNSLKATKEIINNVSELSLEDGIDLGINYNIISRSSKDFEEGINKFLIRKTK